MLSVSVASYAFAPASVPAMTNSRVAASPTMGITPDTSYKPWTSSEISNEAGLKELAEKLNPVVGFWDPMKIAQDATPETIGWWRHAEIKHGRVAMAAFVGYCVQANGIHFPWNLQVPLNNDLPVVSYADISAAGGPADQWDVLPTGAKLQILGAIGFLEFMGEASAAFAMDGTQHYVRGGKPGYYPKLSDKMPHFCLDLYDPFGFSKNKTPEQKERGLLIELNNGRLAMLGIIGMISASKGLIVPGLNEIGIPPYSGEPMAYFSAGDTSLPYVADMLAYKLPF